MSKLFFKDKPIIGLDISTTSIKLMSVDTRKWEVLGYGSVDTDPSSMDTSLDTDGKYIEEQLKKLMGEKLLGVFGSNHVVMSIPTSRTYSRSVTIPSNITSPFDEAVRLEAEQYIPIPIAQLYLDYEITNKNKDATTALMCAVPRKTVDNCVKAAASCNLKVIMIEPGMLSVARLLRYTEDGSLPTVVVDVGAALSHHPARSGPRLDQAGRASRSAGARRRFPSR